jgi:hypothetical protein
METTWDLKGSKHLRISNSENKIKKVCHIKNFELCGNEN